MKKRGEDLPRLDLHEPTYKHSSLYCFLHVTVAIFSLSLIPSTAIFFFIYDMV